MCTKGGAFAHSVRQKGPSLQRRRERRAPFASNATSRADIARPDTRASHGATHMTILGSPEPHCARAHGHAIHVLLLPAQAWPSRQTPDSRPREGAHTLRTHTAPIGRRRSRHPPYPTPRSRRSRRRWPRRGHSRQARHASVRSMKTTYSEETLHRSAFSLHVSPTLGRECCV